MASEIVTLKQKIISTDKLIREYKNSKFDCDSLTKKNEELTRLIDKLHRDLSTRNNECAKLLGEVDPLKKAISRFKQEAEEAHKEAFRWKAEVEANKVYTEQLVEKVKCLEKQEEDTDCRSAKSKDFMKLELKMETVKDQYKEAKEALAKTRKELKQLQTKHKQLVKHALTFGKVAVSHGKLTVTQKRFYQKLCDGTDGSVSDEERETIADVSSNLDEENEIQSKMLEDLLTNDDAQPEAVNTPKSPAKASKTPRSAARSANSKSKPTSSSKTPCAAQVAPRKRGRPRKLNTPLPESPEKELVTKAESRVSLVETSDTDATIESDHEIAIKGISRIRTRSMNKSISSPEKNLTPVKVKREAVSMANLLDDDLPEEPAFKTPVIGAPVPVSDNRIAKVEEDLSLSSSSDDDEEIDNMMTSVLPKVAVEQPQRESPAKAKGVSNTKETVLAKRKSPSPEPPAAADSEPECEAVASDSNRSPSRSPRKIPSSNITASALSIFDDDSSSFKSPSSESDDTDLSLDLASDSPCKRLLPETIAETAAETEASERSDRSEDGEMKNQDDGSRILNKASAAITSTTDRNNDGEISVKGRETVESEPIEAVQDERESTTVESESPTSDPIATLECAESVRESTEFTNEAKSAVHGDPEEHVGVEEEIGSVGDALKEASPIRSKSAHEVFETEPKVVADETSPCDTTPGTVEVEPERIEDLPSNEITPPTVVETDSNEESIMDADLMISIDSETDVEPEQQQGNGEVVRDTLPEKSSNALPVQNDQETLPTVQTALHEQSDTVISSPREQDVPNDATIAEITNVEKEPDQFTEVIAEQLESDVSSKDDKTSLLLVGTDVSEGCKSGEVVEVNKGVTTETLCSAELSGKEKATVEETKCTTAASSIKLASLFAFDLPTIEQVTDVVMETESAEVIPKLVESAVTSQPESQETGKDQASPLVTETNVLDAAQSSKVSDSVVTETHGNVDLASKEKETEVEERGTKTKATSPTKSGSLFEIDVVTDEQVTNVENEPHSTKAVLQTVESGAQVIVEETEKTNENAVTQTLCNVELTSKKKETRIVEGCAKTKATSPTNSGSLFEIDVATNEQVTNAISEPLPIKMPLQTVESVATSEAPTREAEKVNKDVVAETVSDVEFTSEEQEIKLVEECARTKATSSPTKSGSLFEIDVGTTEQVTDVDREPQSSQAILQAVEAVVTSQAKSRNAEKINDDVRAEIVSSVQLTSEEKEKQVEEKRTNAKAASPTKSGSLFELNVGTNEQSTKAQKDSLLTKVNPEPVESVATSQPKSQEAEQWNENATTQAFSSVASAGKDKETRRGEQCTRAKATFPGKSSSLFEIDEPSSTSAEPKTSAAVQVAEIHSSPTKQKSKKSKAKESAKDQTNQTSQSLEPVCSAPTSALVPTQSEACNFKVPAVPPLPGQKDQSSIALISGNRPRLSEGKDREVNKILREARKLLTDMPRVLSPLPEPPKPKPEPKHSMIPRCAFNWMGKKLPISTELTEQFGAYVKPGVRIRVRFRRVSKRLRDLRAPGTLSHLYHGVANYAEAEKKSRHPVDPNAPLIDDSELASILGQPQSDAVQTCASSVNHHTSLHASKNSQKEVPSVTPSRTPSPLSEEITQDVEIEPPVPPSAQDRSRVKSKSRKKNEQQLAPPAALSQTPRRDCQETDVDLEDVRRRPESIQTTVEQTLLNSRPSLEKRPRLVLEEPVQRLQRADLNQLSRPNILHTQVQRPLDTSTPRPILEKRPRLLPDSTEEPVGRLQSATQNQPLRPTNPPNQPAASTKARSNEDLFGSDTNSEDEPEEPAAPAQPRLLPRMVTRPSLTTGLARAKRTEAQPIRPVITPEPLTRLSPRLETTLPKPVRPVSITPCSDAMLSAVAKAKCTPRIVAPRKQSKEPTMPAVPPANTPDKTPDQVFVPLGDPSSRKRIAHAPKRPFELSPESSDLASPLKKAKTPVEPTPIPSFATALPTPNKESAHVVASLTASTISSKIRVRQDVFDTSQSDKETSQIEAQHLRKTTLDDDSSSDDEPLTIDEMPASPTPAETAGDTADESTAPEETPQSPVSPRMETDTPQSPPRADVNVPVVPIRKTRIIPHDTSCVTEIPTEAPQPARVAPTPPLASSKSYQAPQVIRSAEDLPPYLEALLKDPPEAQPKLSKCVKRIKTTVRQAIDKVCNAEELTDDIFDKAIKSLTLGLIAKHPFIVIRHFVSTIMRAFDAGVDLTYTPPLPALPVVHQRCIALLLTLDEKNRDFEVDLEQHAHRYSNYFLSEVSHTMFGPENAMTVDEMCSLARAYVGLCRAIGDLQRARCFLFDCMYFYPPFAYALAHVIVILWGEVLRPVTFPTGPSCVDQTIVFLLLFCSTVKPADGTKARVINVRSLLQGVYGYKESTVTTAPVLLDCLMNRFKDTQSADEASSLSWCLALIGRWQGVSWAINTIQKVLWPFMQRWSAGEGTNAGAVAAITGIGLLGKYVPAAQRTGVDMVFGAMKALVCSPDVAPSVAEAAIETAILLGSETKAQAVLDILKEWSPPEDVSSHLQDVLKAFLKKNVKSENSLVNDANDENNSGSE